MVLKFFDLVLKFELPNARVLNFPKISGLSLIGLVLIIGDCVYSSKGLGKCLDVPLLYIVVAVGSSGILKA